MFEGILVEKDDAGYRATLRSFDAAELPEGDVRVRVEYSTLNYKDALAITGKAPVVRRFPMVPGIDLAGVVEQSESPTFQPGDAVSIVDPEGTEIARGLSRLSASDAARLARQKHEEQGEDVAVHRDDLVVLPTE